MVAKSKSHMKNVVYKKSNIFHMWLNVPCNEGKNHNYHSSQRLLYAEIWAKQIIFIIPNVYLNAKREGPRKEPEDSVQRAYWGGLLRTPWRDWLEQGWADKEVATEASANLQRGVGTGMNLQSCPELGQGAWIFILP